MLKFFVVFACLFMAVLAHPRVVGGIPAPKHVYSATFVNDSPNNLRVAVRYVGHDGRELNATEQIAPCENFTYSMKTYDFGTAVFRYEVREIDVEGPAFTAKLQAPFDGVDSPQLQWWFAIRGSNTQLISSRVPIVTSMCHEGQN